MHMLFQISMLHYTCRNFFDPDLENASILKRCLLINITVFFFLCRLYF